MESISERIDNVTNIAPEYKAETIPAPISVKVELTNRCNFGCHFCAHGNGATGKGGDMPLEEFKRLAKETREAGVKELGMFYIGESMLYPQLADAIRYAKQECGYPYVFLTTNGSLATPERVASIMEAGLDSLKFSLNSGDEWQFRQLTSMAPSMFKTVMDNVKMAHETRKAGEYKTRLYASSIKYDGKQMGKMKEMIAKVLPYLDEHYWLPLLSFGDTAKKIVDEGYQTVVGNPGRADTMRPPIPCWAVFREGHITKDSKLSACCFDSSDSWIMADLKQVTFMEGWNSGTFRELRKAHLGGDCHNTPCEGCLY